MSIEVTLHIYFLTKWQDHVSDVDQSVSDQVTNVKIIPIHSQFLIECTEGNPNDKSAVLLKEKTQINPFRWTWSIVDSGAGQRRRRWPATEPMLEKRPIFGRQ